MSLPYEFRYARLIYIRWPLASPILLSLLGLTTSYVFKGVQNPRLQPLIAAFDFVPVFWPLVFGLPLIAMCAALWRRAWIPQAYVSAAVAFWLYGVALTLGAILAGSSWATASLSMSLSLACLVLAKAYAKGR